MPTCLRTISHNEALLPALPVHWEGGITLICYLSIERTLFRLIYGLADLLVFCRGCLTPRTDVSFEGQIVENGIYYGVLSFSGQLRCLVHFEAIQDSIGAEVNATVVGTRKFFVGHTFS